MAEMQCGVITLKGSQVIEGSCGRSTEWLQTVLDLNGAYRRGYRDCGTVLMPELMKLKGNPPKKEFVLPTPAPISTTK